MSTYIICTRCGRPMRPMYSDGTGAPTNGYCQCAPATSWGDVPLLDWRDAELSRLRIQVEQMRIDAIKDREAFSAKLVIEADTLRADLAEARADVARFEAALDVANRELAEARRERDNFKKQAIKGARGVYMDDKRRHTIYRAMDDPEQMGWVYVYVANAYLRLHRPWWSHPRWHVWHWRIQIPLLQDLKRFLFSRCAGCGKRFAWGYAPISNQWNGDGPRWFKGERGVFHHECIGHATLPAKE